MEEVSAWFARHGRDLPWRVSPRRPWGVLVSEVMLQQTPVNRVVPAWRSWMSRWPEPGLLAAEPAGEAVRMWGRLGYPRRALRLHAAAVVVERDHRGQLPDDYQALRSLPGVGDYTAAAVMAFAHRSRVPVMDTNVRRVLARSLRGLSFPATSAPVRAEREQLLALLPEGGERAALHSEALMELGALVCTARRPACEQCPLVSSCAWVAAGRPDNQDPPGRQPPFAGSDRQVRGRILQLVRSTPTAVAQAEIDLAWPDQRQLHRAQRSLLADGLLIRRPDGRFVLPGC